jgi:hypothetical protein
LEVILKIIYLYKVNFKTIIMNVRTIEFKYKIGQDIYHVTPDSPKGVIIDASYSFHTNKVSYAVAWDFSNESICAEHELTEDKIF